MPTLPYYKRAKRCLLLLLLLLYSYKVHVHAISSRRRMVCTFSAPLPGSILRLCRRLREYYMYHVRYIQQMNVAESDDNSSAHVKP